MFGFTEDMTEKQELVRKFCEEWIYPNLAEIDAGTCCPDYIWEEWCKIPGFASPCAPKFTGGEESRLILVSLCGKNSVRLT